MNLFGLFFLCVCFASFWFSLWAIAELRWVRRERLGFICRGRAIERRMLYEFYIKMLATNVELAH